MVLLYVLIIVVLSIVVLLFMVASNVKVYFDSASSDLNFTLLWLYPFLKSVITFENDSFILSMYVFNKRIVRKELKSNETKVKNKNLLNKLKPTNIHIRAKYGFKDPHFTGLTFAALNTFPKFFKMEIYQRPDFLVSSDFINIHATAKLNLGRFLLELV